jgi:hypothetical protein
VYWKSFIKNNCWGVAYWRAIKTFHLIRLVIFNKFCLKIFHFWVIYCMHQNSYRKLAANSVSSFGNILIKSFSIVLLNQSHSLMVQLLNILMNHFSLADRLIGEMRSPMAKITGYNKNSVFIVKILRKKFPVFFGYLLINYSHHYWNNLHPIFEYSFNHREMHL